MKIFRKLIRKIKNVFFVFWKKTIFYKVDLIRQDVSNCLENTNILQARLTSNCKIRCAFLVHHYEAWDSIGPIFEAMRASEKFEPIVISIPRKFPGSTVYENENLISAYLDSINVPHIRFSGTHFQTYLSHLKWLKLDIIFRQSQWDSDIPEAFSTRNISFARICFVPYEIMNFLENEAEDAINSIFHNTAWRIFCANEPSFVQMKNKQTIQARNICITGHPKVAAIKNAQPLWPIRRKGESRKAKRLIWSAHHSIGNDWVRFGNFLAIYDSMLKWAKSSPDIEIVLCLHPALRTKLAELNKCSVSNFFRDWNKLENTYVFEGGAYGSLFQASDFMICDSISWLLEYQIVNKPLVFLERKDRIRFNEFGEEIAKGLYCVSGIEEGQALIESLASGKADCLKIEREKIAEKYLNEQGAVQNILEHLMEAHFRELNPYRLS